MLQRDIYYDGFKNNIELWCLIERFFNGVTNITFTNILPLKSNPWKGTKAWRSMLTS